MRELADAERIRRFMQALGAAAPAYGVCYLIGGATAVLLGWRPTTIDVDIELEPEQDELLRALPAIKAALRVNVELASPRQFLPLPAGWRERSPSVSREGRLAFKHFDFYSQALAKIERGLVERGALRRYFEEIEPQLYRFPAIDPSDFKRRVEDISST